MEGIGAKMESIRVITSIYFFIIIFYINERSYVENKNNIRTHNASVIDYDDKIKLQTKNFINILLFSRLNESLWHAFITKVNRK